jgi:hypothetical protein
MWLSLDIDDMAMAYGHGREEGCASHLVIFLVRLLATTKSDLLQISDFL